MAVQNLDTYKTTFAERLIEHLDGKSISAFSKTLGIPGRTLNSWIQKITTPRMEYLILLAKELRCSIDYLVGLED
ncbi:MAG: helix-turn-helix domain-containing protein [Firmicutes bacterium]|nr:helix-turn-helix domain-containing protein [Bacillota bacterium]